MIDMSAQQPYKVRQLTNLFHDLIDPRRLEVSIEVATVADPAFGLRLFQDEDHPLWTCCLREEFSCDRRDVAMVRQSASPRIMNGFSSTTDYQHAASLLTNEPTGHPLCSSALLQRVASSPLGS